MSNAGGNLKKYKRLKYLGKGSYGAAILVELRSDSRQKFVIKEIVIGHLKDAEQAAAKKEAEVLHQMQHSNITMYVESFVENSKLFIVMEYADGGDLSTTVAKRKKVNSLWTENELMRIFVQICLALKHVHDQNILHRDLKSQNIFLTTKGIVKLGDFGIAKVLDSTEDQARTQIGTPYYLSPEICESLPYGRQSDVWSLGVILFELLTFDVPFQAPSLPALIHRICTTDPAFNKISKTYSTGIIDLVRSLLNKDPQSRPSLKQVVGTDFLKAHICKLLSHTLKVGNGGVQTEKVDINGGGAGSILDGDDINISPSKIDPEEADKNIEFARRRQHQVEMENRKAEANAERQAHRQGEREKLRKFREDMAKLNKMGKNKNVNDVVVVQPAGDAPPAYEMVVQRQGQGQGQGRVKGQGQGQGQGIPQQNDRERSLIQAQEERIRQLERQVQEQRRQAQQKQEHSSPAGATPAVVHISSVRRSLFEMQQRGEIEARNKFAQQPLPSDMDNFNNNAKTNANGNGNVNAPHKIEDQAGIDIVRQQFFDNRAAAAAVKARVQAEERGISIGEARGILQGGGGGLSYSHTPAVSPAPVEERIYDYGKDARAEDRIAMVRAQRDRTKEAELEEREKQLKMAYEANRDERRRLAERAKAGAASMAFEINMNGSDVPSRTGHSDKAVEADRHAMPKKNADLEPAQGKNDATLDRGRERAGVRGSNGYIGGGGGGSIAGKIEDEDNENEAATFLFQKKDSPGIQIARGHFHRDDTVVPPEADERAISSVSNSPSPSISVAAEKTFAALDRAHLDDEIAEGKDNAVLRKLHDRRQRELQARENARAVFRKLQEQRKRAAEIARCNSPPNKNAGGHRPQTGAGPILALIDPYPVTDDGYDSKAEAGIRRDAMFETQVLVDAREEERDLEQNISSWLSRQHNDFLASRKKKNAAKEKLTTNDYKAEANNSPDGGNDGGDGDLDAGDEVADMQCMLANLLIEEEKDNR